MKETSISSNGNHLLIVGQCSEDLLPVVAGLGRLYFQEYQRKRREEKKSSKRGHLGVELIKKGAPKEMDFLLEGHRIHNEIMGNVSEVPIETTTDRFITVLREERDATQERLDQINKLITLYKG